MSEPVIVVAKRTAIGKKGGIFRSVPPEILASTVIDALLDETNINPDEIDDVILGNAIGPGGNIARLSALQSSLSINVPGVTIDRQCGSGIEAIHLACQLIRAKAGSIYIAGGVESSSLAPWKIEKPNSLYDIPNIMDRAKFAPDCIGDPDMGIAAENVAKKYHISRLVQDKYTFKSYQKAYKAREAGWMNDEIVTLNGHKIDEGPRKMITMEKLQRMKAVFETNGTVTIGNACGIHDGAAAVLVMSEEKCKELQLQAKLRFKQAATSGVDPNLLGIGPVPAVRKLLQKTNEQIENIDIIEFNEAFASQVLASLQSLSIQEDKVNLYGGALAYGHPYGASGAILIVRLCNIMEKGNYQKAIATMGIAGGMGIASLYEKYESDD